MQYVLLWNDIMIIVCLAAIVAKLFPPRKKDDPEVEDDDIE